MHLTIGIAAIRVLGQNSNFIFYSSGLGTVYNFASVKFPTHYNCVCLLCFVDKSVGAASAKQGAARSQVQRPTRQDKPITTGPHVSHAAIGRATVRHGGDPWQGHPTDTGLR